MRARTVYESLKFERGLDPKDAMHIGMDSMIKNFVENETIYNYNKLDLLWICAQYGKTDFVKYLLDKGYDVHEGNYALRWASGNGHTETVKILLAAGADVHTDNDLALRWASHNGHTETVKVLEDWIAKEKGLKESLKFERGLDPKKAMNVGLWASKEFKTGDELVDYIVFMLPYIFDGKIPEDIIDSKNTVGINYRYYIMIRNTLHKYNHKISGVNKNPFDPKDKPYEFEWPGRLRKRLIEMGY